MPIDSSSVVYLDHNATTGLLPEAAAAMRPFLGPPGNPASAHAPGQRARAAVDAARGALRDLVGARDGDVVFTGSGTEALALALLGIARARSLPRRLVTSAVEHSAVLEAAAVLETEGWRVDRVPPGPDGRIEARRMAEAIGPDTGIVCVQHANNETGAVHPVETIGRSCGRAVLVVDAVQSAGKVPVDAKRWNAGAVAVSGHKIGGPQGVGALWLAPGVDCRPLVPGSQEGGLRGGTHNVAGIVGLGAAAGRARERAASRADELRGLRDGLEERVARLLPEARITVPDEPRLPNTVHLTFPPETGPDLVLALDLEGFAVSAGSACRSGSPEPSHVLRAQGIADARARTAVRVSLGTGNTMTEIEAFVAALVRTVRSRRPKAEASR